MQGINNSEQITVDRDRREMMLRRMTWMLCIKPIKKTFCVPKLFGKFVKELDKSGLICIKSTTSLRKIRYIVLKFYRNRLVNF